jgi:hypothetical protein
MLLLYPAGTSNQSAQRSALYTNTSHRTPRFLRVVRTVNFARLCGHGLLFNVDPWTSSSGPGVLDMQQALREAIHSHYCRTDENVEPRCACKPLSASLLRLVRTKSCREPG